MNERTSKGSRCQRYGALRLPIIAHTSRPWRIHEIVPDFAVEDVWALPTPGGPGELPRLVSQFGSLRFPADAPLPMRVVWEARRKIGRFFGWDRHDAGVGTRVASLRERLPSDLRATAPGPDTSDGTFTSLFLLNDEWATEIANRTVHSVMHVSWVRDDNGGHHGRLAVLVKPNGCFGAAYMAAIKPFRRLLVYPALIHSIERNWLAETNGNRPDSSDPAGRSTGVLDRVAALAGVAVPTILAALAGLHAAWALGSHRPAASEQALAEHLAGADAMPPAAEVWPVAAALLTAAGLVARAARGVRTRPVRIAAWGVAAVLLIRSVAFLPSDLNGGVDDPFSRLDLALYSPLCFLLGISTAAVVRRSGGGRTTAPGRLPT